MIRFEVETTRQTEMVPITDQVQEAVTKLSIQDGAVVVFIPHTTAAVTINESADPMVAHDIIAILDRVIPFHDEEYRHMEANSAAHIKAVLVGTSETVMVRNGHLHLGTWQGLFLCEFDGPRHRLVDVGAAGDGCA